MSITTINWDTANDDLALPFALVKGATALQLKLRQRFRFFLAEWFLNTLEGIPYYRDVLIKNPDISTVRSVFRQVILDTQDVASVRTLTININSSERLMTVNFISILSDGSVFDTTLLDNPFVITV